MSHAVPAKALPIPAAPVPAARVAARSARAAPLLKILPLALLYYSFLLFSPEVSIDVGGVNLPTYRIVLLLLALPAVVIMIKRPGRGINFIDGAVAIASFWIMLSFALNYGLATGLVRGGGALVDIALSYLVARASITSFDDLRYFLLAILPGLLFAGFVLMVESLSGKLLLRPAFAAIFGNVSSAVTDGGSVTELVNEKRLGLLRAYGPFGHPILAGIVMVSLLPLYFFSGLRSWPYIAGIAVALTGFFSLSSAAILCLLVAITAIAINYAKQFVPKLSWWTISSLMGLALLIAHLASQNGIVAVLSRITLTPHTAQYRRAIWDWGWRTIEKYPGFGIGYKSWERLPWMHDSVDAHFLLLGMRHGLLVPVILVIALAYGMIRLGLLSPVLRKVDRDLAIGINISMMLIFTAGQTVAFYGSSQIAFMAFLAILASLVSCAQNRADYVRNLDRQAVLARRRAVFAEAGAAAAGAPYPNVTGTARA